MFGNKEEKDYLYWLGYFTISKGFGAEWLKQGSVSYVH